MKDIVLFGMPGAGKGTQAELFIEKFGDQYRHISTGDIFRALLSKPNAIGNYVQNRFDAGLLIDDQVTISLFNAYFFGVVDDKKHMLLDGYPRTLTQLDALLELSKTHDRELLGIYFDLSEEETIKRMVERGREGEDEETIKTRLEEYYSKTQPIVDAFDQHATLVRIDATPSIEDIHQEVVKLIG